MRSEPFTPADIAQLRVEADEARCLACMFNDPATVFDLLAYAAALEADAGRYEAALRHRDDVVPGDNSGQAGIFVIGVSR